MKFTISRLAILFLMALVYGPLYAQSSYDAEEMTLQENISLPVVPKNASNAIVRHMERIGKTFSKRGVDVKYTRRGEVVDIIFPCNAFFKANSVELHDTAYKTLDAFNALLKLPSLYKILVVVHADDTGSSAYADTLTDDRAAAIDDYFAEHFPAVKLNVIPYGMGCDEPRASNNSIAGRHANRRVEFYIVPEQQTIEMAKSGKL